MSADLGSSPGSSAAPPPSAPAAAPPAAPAAPPAAPVAPAAPAVVVPDVAPVNDAVASATLGVPAQPAKPSSVAEVQAIYRQQVAEAERAAQQPEQSVEAQITEPAAPAPVEAQPVEEVEPIVEPAAEEAPTELAAIGPGEDEYRESAWSPEEVQAKYQRNLSKKALAEITQREAHRAELIQTVDKIGGDLGVQVASVINPILLKDNPTDADVDAVFDQILLPENAGAEQLFDLMGKRLVNMQLQDEETGREFGSQMISEEWGKNEDGSAFDFLGMKPIELVDFLLRAAKAKDGEGDPILNMEFLKTELDGQAKPAPSERELALQRENEELRTKNQAETTAKEAEETLKREADKKIYNTQAKGFVTRSIMADVMPLAVKANWAASEGETGEQAERKKVLGRLVTADINSHIMGAPDALTPEYSEVKAMIDNNTAFDRVSGEPTPRFRNKLKPLRTMAKARFNEIQRTLSPQIKFTAVTSRNAQLVKKTQGAAPATEAPQLATPPADPNRQLTTQERLDEIRKPYREAVKADQQARQTGVVR